MCRSQNRLARNTTLAAQIERNNKDRNSKEQKIIEIILGGDTIPNEVHLKSVNKHRYTAKTTKKAKRLDLDRRTHKNIQYFGRMHNKKSMFSTP